MPGFERRLARYPQLYSRIGFVHQYRPLDPEDIHPVVDPAQETDTDAVLTIIRITGGNFRLIERLMTQVLRVMNINQLDIIVGPVSPSTSSGGIPNAPSCSPDHHNRRNHSYPVTLVPAAVPGMDEGRAECHKFF